MGPEDGSRDRGQSIVGLTSAINRPAPAWNDSGNGRLRAAIVTPVNNVDQNCDGF